MEITNLDQFQNDFNSAIQNSANSKLIIENEITEVKNFVNTIPNYKTWSKLKPPSHLHKANKIFNLHIPVSSKTLFNQAFYGFQLNGNFSKEKLYQESEDTHKHNLDVVKQAFELLEYYRWLNELLNPSKKVEKKSSLYHKDKMLALYYLGLDMRKFHNNVQSAKILAKILDLDYTNTKDYLTYFDGRDCKVKTKENIEKMLELFENETFISIQETIKKDLEK